MNYFHIAAALTAGASVTKTPCKLHAVTINTKGAAANVFTLYDNNKGDNSGNVIGIFDTTVQPAYFLLDVDTLNGLSYSSAAGSGADLTLAYQ